MGVQCSAWKVQDNRGPACKIVAHRALRNLPFGDSRTAGEHSETAVEHAKTARSEVGAWVGGFLCLGQ